MTCKERHLQYLKQADTHVFREARSWSNAS